MRIISDVVIFDLTGRFSSMEFKLHDRAKEVLNLGCRGFIFNMTEVSYIDSFAVGQMFSNLDFNAGQEWTDSASAANRTRPEGSRNHETRYDLSDLYG